MTGQEVAQQLVTGVADGGLYALVGVSFWLINSVTQRFHVAYVASYVVGAYLAIWSRNSLPLPHVGDILVGIGGAVALGLFCEAVVYRKIASTAERGGHDQLIPVFVASLGITIVTQNVISWIWNTEPLGFSIIDNEGMALGDARYTKLQLYTLVLAVVVIGTATLVFRLTRVGKQIDGVRVNQEMARVVGINPGRVFLLVFAVGSAIAGLLGIIEASAAAAAPQMGFNYVFYGFVIAFLAGDRATPLRLGVIGVIVGVVQSLSALFLPLVYAPMVVFVILLVYLILLPTDLRRHLVSRFVPTSP